MQRNPRRQSRGQLIDLEGEIGSGGPHAGHIPLIRREKNEPQAVQWDRSDLTVVAGGGFDLCITHALALQIVPASLSRCSCC